MLARLFIRANILAAEKRSVSMISTRGSLLMALLSHSHVSRATASERAMVRARHYL